MEYKNGEYIEKEQISKTQMSRVFLAKKKDTDRIWIIKQIPSRAIKRELEILKKLEHHNLPTIIDYFEDYDKSGGSEDKSRVDTYVVMQHIKGQTLGKSGFPPNTNPENAVKDYLEQICSVFSYLHSQNPPIIHKDVKPNNIIRTQEGHLYLIDFGISKDRADAEIMALTEGFAAPEQYSRDAVTDCRTDIYSIGATLYYLLSGSSATVPAKPLSENSSVNISPGLERIIMKCLNKEPADRYQTIAELKKDLNEIHKFTREYKIKLAKIAVSTVCTVAFAAVTVTGVLTMRSEKEERFFSLVETGYDRIRAEDHVSAEQLFEESIQVYPNRPEGYIGLSNLYIAGRDYTGSELLLLDAGNVLDGVDSNAQFQYCLGSTYYYLKNYSGALECFKRAVAAEPDNLAYRRDLAVCYTKMGLFDDSKAELELIGSDSFDKLYVLAQIYEQQGDWANALENYERCFASPDGSLSANAYIAAADLYGRNPDLPDAADKRIKILESAENDSSLQGKSTILDMLGDTYFKKGRDASAKTDKERYFNLALDKFLELKYQQLGGIVNDINIATVYQYLGKYEDCKNILLDAADIYENDYRPYFRLAILELEIQAKNPRGGRSYEKFREYAEKSIMAAKTDNEDTMILRSRLKELNLVGG